MQLNLFNAFRETKKISKPIRLIELFAGIGAQHKALSVLGVPFESWKICEWAVPSIKAYNAIHIKDTTDYSQNKTLQEMLERINGVSTNYNTPIPEKVLAKKPESWIRDVYNNCVATRNLVNIMNVKGKDLEIVDADKYEYILTYSFPCQDLSLAGKRAGLEKSQAEGGTRSGLLWEVERLLTELYNDDKHIQVLIMENVPALIGKDNVIHFAKWMERLEQLGYNSFFNVLNGKDYGIPQNRERVFMISVYGDYAYDFPVKLELKYCLKDFLESKVDEKYYLSPKMVDYVLARTPLGEKEFKSANNIRSKNSNRTSGTITTKGSGTGSSCRGEDTFIVDNMSQEEIDLEIYGKYSEESLRRIKENLVDDEEESPTITANAMQSINHQNCVLIKEATKRGYKEAEVGDGIDISTRMETHRGTVQKGSCQTLTTEGGNDVGVVVEDETQS